MFQKRRIGVLLITSMIALSITACLGTIQTFPTPVNTSPTSPLPPTETLIPVATGTPMIATPIAASTVTQQVGGQINILELTSFKDEANYWYFYGLVRNDTDRTIYDLQIEIRLLDSTGAEIYTYATYTMLSQLAPGDTSPFSDFTIEPFPNGSKVQAAVVGENSTAAVTRAVLEYRGVTLWVDDNNNVYLSGEVFNANPNPVQLNAIAATLIDSTGKLVTASYAYSFLGYIEPNGISPFSIMFDAPPGQAASLTNYNFYTDAVITNPTTMYDIKLSDQKYKYQDSMGDIHLVGLVTNNTAGPLNLYLVAGFYDESGNCVDANYVYLPMPLNPGETFPYDFSLWGPVNYVPAAYEAVSQYKVFVDWRSTNAISAKTYTLATENNTNTFDEGSGKYSGMVVNNSGQDLTTAIVVVALYDKSSGDLVATNYTFVAQSLPSNASGSYEVFLYPPGDFDLANANVVITALGQ